MSDPLAPEIKRLLATPEPPSLGPKPRTGVQTQSALEHSLETLFAGSTLTAQRQDLVRSLVLLWHDHLDAAHLIAQTIENRDGSFVHGVMHRREPDYGNAKYWFQRVGLHPVFPVIAARAAGRLKGRDPARWGDRLLPKGMWDPFAFVDACAAAAETLGPVSERGWPHELKGLEKTTLEQFAEQMPGSPSQRELLRDLQKIEMESLLDHLLQT